jgi:hypothetical protein
MKNTISFHDHVARPASRVPLWTTAVLMMAVLPATSQAQDLTGYSDNHGKHVVYVADNGHLKQLTCSAVCYLTSSWVAEDLTQLAGGPTLFPSGPFNGGSSNLTSFSDFAGEHVFYRDPHTNHINHLLFTGGTWRNQDVGYSLSSETRTSGYSDGTFERLFYTTIDGHVHMLTSTNGSSWGHSDLTTPTGAAASPWVGPGTTSFHDALGEHVFYVGIDGDLHQLYGYWQLEYVCTPLPRFGCGLRRILKWADQDVGGRPESGHLSSFSDGTGEHVFYFYYDLHQYNDHIHEHENPVGSTGWLDNDWGTASGSNPFGFGLTSLSSSLFGKQVFHVDNYPLHLYLQSGSNGRQDLTIGTNAPPVSVECAELMTSFTNSSDVWEPEDVFYVGTDGDLHHLEALTFQGLGWYFWTDNNLTTGSFQPTVAGSRCR